MASDPFDLVKQFAALRESAQAPPTSVASYLPPEVVSPAIPSTAIGEPPAPAGGPRPGDGHNHGAATAEGVPGIIDYNGRKISGGIRSYADALTSQGLRLSSGYRDPEHNRRVGGVKNSLHTKQGKNGALDLVGSAKQMQQGAAWAKANGAREVLIHNVGSGQHLHVGW